jgi:hypothetical protein
MDMTPKNLLKRVLQFAREELERRARSEHDAEREPGYDTAPPPADHAADEGYTGVMHVREPALEDEAGLNEAGLNEAGLNEDAANEAGVHGLEVLRPHQGGSLTLRWSVSEAAVARAQVLLSGNPVLCLRLVSFSKQRDDVLREVQDRPGIDRAGQVELQEPTQRAVVSLGLRAGERFVSIAHHVL